MLNAICFVQYFNYIATVSFTVPMVIVKRIMQGFVKWEEFEGTYQRGIQNP